MFLYGLSSNLKKKKKRKIHGKSYLQGTEQSKRRPAIHKERTKLTEKSCQILTDQSNKQMVEHGKEKKRKRKENRHTKKEH